jgi:hypothetical protein
VVVVLGIGKAEVGRRIGRVAHRRDALKPDRSNSPGRNRLFGACGA